MQLYRCNGFRANFMFERDGMCPYVAIPRGLLSKRHLLRIELSTITTEVEEEPGVLQMSIESSSEDSDEQ